MNGAKKPAPCAFCDGSGQLSSFKGESRFLLTIEECPHCCGTGRDLSGSAEEAKTPSVGRTGPVSVDPAAKKA